MDIETRQKREKLRATLRRQYSTAWNEYHMFVQYLKEHIPSDRHDEIMSIVTRMCEAQGKVMVADYRYKETMTSTWTSSKNN